MAIKKLNPYLQFNGNADAVIERYVSALGARVLGLMRFGEVLPAEAPADDKKRVMHAVLRVDSCDFMVSDTRPGERAETGGNVQVCLDFDDADDMARRFQAMAVGATGIMAIHDTFWGAKFGMLTDVFGVQWMFHCELKKS